MELEELFQESITGHFMYYFDSGKSEFLTSSLKEQIKKDYSLELKYFK